MIKYLNKKKFVNRGMYFVLDGEYKGSFLVNIKEYNTDTNKALMLFPNKERISLTANKIEELFDSNYFEYVKRIPKRVYNVCVAEYKEELKS